MLTWTRCKFLDSCRAEAWSPRYKAFQLRVGSNRLGHPTFWHPQSTMDPDHKLPPVPTGQSSNPHVQREPSPLVGSGHVNNGGRPQTQSAATERPLLGGSEGHSPAGDPDAGLEPVPQPPPAARSRNGHMLPGPLQHSFMGHARHNASGIGWIVPEVEEKPHVCVASHFALACNPQLDITATYNWRATRPIYCRCGEGKSTVRQKRSVSNFNLVCSVSGCKGFW
jgi:hypothetical protein